MRNEEKLKNWGLAGKERYYYVKFGLNKHGCATGGTATVCVIENEKGLSYTPFKYVRGIAFSNPKDQFSRKLGRAIALGRAVKAIERSQTSEAIPGLVPVEILTRRMGGWTHLSVWNATLSASEKKLFEKKEEGSA